MKDTDNPYQLLTVDESKNILKCSKSYVYKLASTGVLKCVCLPAFNEPGKRKKKIVRFRYEDIVALIERATT